MTHTVYKLIKDGSQFACYFILMISGNIRNTCQSCLEYALLLDKLQRRQYITPVFVEVFLHELTFEWNGDGTNHVDTFLLNSVDLHVKIDKLIYFASEVAIDRKFGHR